ncbi:hypothetical protein EMIT0P395_90008 [Pseudomonas sp. IT-P395]
MSFLQAWHVSPWNDKGPPSHDSTGPCLSPESVYRNFDEITLIAHGAESRPRSDRSLKV